MYQYTLVDILKTDAPYSKADYVLIALISDQTFLGLFLKDKF